MRQTDARSFTEFAHAAIPRLRRVAFAQVGNWRDADDVVQSTLEKVMRSWQRIDDRDPYAYARAVLINQVISESRRPWRRREHPRGLDPQPDQIATRDEGVSDDMMAALKTLSPMQRSVVILRYYEDLSVQTTAEVLRCSEGNVKRHAADALKRIGTALSLDHCDRDKNPNL